MKRMIAVAWLTLGTLALTVTDTLACTTFCLRNKGEVLFGKNYDWMVPDGAVFVNRRGVSKVSAESENPARWTSKFGSVTFNQYGWETPSGGMNEAGVVIELMWLDGTTYPTNKALPTLDVLEWIQYQLDTAGTTAEVVKNSEAVRINSRTPLHYLVNDKSGNSATFEWLDGKLVVHAGDKLPVATLTNDTYSRSLDFASKTDVSTANGPGSLQRFARASAGTKGFTAKERVEKEAVDYAFGILADAAQPGYTQWSIVYDQTRGRIFYRTRKNSQIRSIDAKSFDYGCNAQVLMLDIDAGSGDVTKSFATYTRAANRDLIERAFNATDFLRSVPAKSRDEYAQFAERFTCRGEPKANAPAKASLTALDIIFPFVYLYRQMIV